ncbi:MAG: hypothetical protein ABUL52_01100 [Solimonas sp.]
MDGWKIYCALILSVTLVACGGGGSGGGSTGSNGGSNNNNPQIVATPGSLTQSAAINDSPNQTAVISLSLRNIPASAKNIAGAYTINTGISNAVIAWTDTTTASITVYFQAPESLKPGTYTGHVRVYICQDSTCSSAIAGTETTIPVSYVVTLPTAPPVITFSQNPVVTNALAADFTQKGVIVGLTQTNFGEIPVVTVTHSGQLVQNILVTSANSIGLATGLNISLPAANTLGIGTYTDTLTVTVCLDATCVNQATGSPYTIPITYVIDNMISVDGAQGYTLSAIKLANQGAVWDQVHQKLYVIQQGTDGIAPGYLIPLDPATGMQDSPVALTATPMGSGDVSSDGTWLYLGMIDGTIQRLHLPDLTLDLTIPLGVDITNGYQQYAADIRAAPGAPQTFAVALSNGWSYGLEEEVGVAVFDGALRRSNIANATWRPSTSGVIVDFLAWNPAGNTLYGTYDQVSGQDAMFIMPVSTDGIDSYTATTQSITGRAHFVGNMIYTDSGDVYNTLNNASGTQIQPFPKTSYTSPSPAYSYNLCLAPDSVRDQLFVIGYDDALYSGYALAKLKRSDQSFTGMIELPSLLAPGYRGLTRWGDAGLVWLSSGYVVLLSGNFVSH